MGTVRTREACFVILYYTALLQCKKLKNSVFPMFQLEGKCIIHDHVCVLTTDLVRRSEAERI